MRNAAFKAHPPQMCGTDPKWTWKAGCGIPLDFSKEMNPCLLQDITTRSFIAGPPPSGTRCQQKFNGIVCIDIPEPHLNEDEIAKAIILSNCALFDKMSDAKQTVESFRLEANGNQPKQKCLHI